MELSSTTLLLEAINFLVLIWIMQRLFYRPIRAVIEQRRTAIEQTLTEAATLQQSGLELQQQYQQRQQIWEQERQQARLTLVEELALERQQQLQALQQELEQRQQKQEVNEQQRQQARIHAAEAEAIRNGGRFTAKLLQQLASPQLEQQLVTLLIQGLQQLPTERLTTLRTDGIGGPIVTYLHSAYPLEKDELHQLQQQLTRIHPDGVQLEWSQDPTLMAGVHITVGDWVVGLNLRDELRGYAELDHETNNQHP